MREYSLVVDSYGKIQRDLRKNLLGYGGEHNATALIFKFNNLSETVFASADYFRVVFDGYYSDELYLSEEKITYIVPGDAIVPPCAHGQLIAYKTVDGNITMIAKSEIFEFDVGLSEIPYQKISDQPDAFERALEQCRNLSKQSEISAENAAKCVITANECVDTVLAAVDNAASLEQQCESYSLAASDYASLSAASAAEAEISADIVNEVKALPQMTANAIVGKAKGKAVLVRDVSPLTHELKVSVDTEGLETAEVVKQYNYTESDGQSLLRQVFYPGEDIDLSYLELNHNLIGDADSVEFRVVFYTVEPTVYYYAKLNKGGEGSYAYYYPWEDLTGSVGDVDLSKVTLMADGFPSAIPTPSTLGITSYTATVTKTEAGTTGKVMVCGRNVLPFCNNTESFSVNGIQFCINDGSIVLDGIALDSIASLNSAFKSSFGFRVPSSKYYLSYYGQPIDATAVVYDEGDNEVCRIELAEGKVNTTLELQDEKRYYLGFDIDAGLEASSLLLELMLELEIGDGYEASKEHQEVMVDAYGVAGRLHSVGPNMTLICCNNFEVEYNVDIDKMPFCDNSNLLNAKTVKGAINELVSLLPTCDARGEIVTLPDSSGLGFKSLKIACDKPNPTVTISGKNLCNNVFYSAQIAQNKLRVRNFTELTTSYADVTQWQGICVIVPVKAGQEITVSGNVSGYYSDVYYSYYASRDDVRDNSKVIGEYGQNATTVPDGANYAVIGWVTNKTTGARITFSDVQVEYGKKATEYEPYKEPKTVTIPYEFSEGDSITVKNGAVKITLNGVQTDITDTEIGNKLLSLRTNYPSTTVVSDGTLELSYIADTKNYIDNKIAALQAALTNYNV